MIKNVKYVNWDDFHIGVYNFNTYINHVTNIEEVDTINYLCTYSQFLAFKLR